MTSARGQGDFVHATAVLIGEGALVLLGASGAGKSSLAERLIAEARMRGHFSRLIGDDRVAFRPAGGRVVVSAHPATRGQIERRGSGIARTQWLAEAIVKGVIALEAEPSRMPNASDEVIELCGVEVPRLTLRADQDLLAKAHLALEWLGA